MKILFTKVGNVFATPAFKRAVDGLSSCITARIEILHWDPREYEANSNSGFNEYKYKKTFNYINVIGWFFLSENKIRKMNPDVVWCMSFLQMFIILPLRLFYRFKIVYDPRDYFAISHNFNKQVENILKKFDLFFCKNSSLCVVPDDFGKSYFSNLSNVEVIYNTVVDYGYRKKEDHSPLVKIGYLGYISKDRNWNEVVRLANEKNIELHIATTYVSEDLISSVKSLENIIWHGSLSHSDSQYLLSKMDYCLITNNPNIGNYINAYPTKFYDCLAVGTPFICSKGLLIEKHCTKESKNIAVEYNEPILGLEKTKMSTYNRSLYESKYSYSYVQAKIAELITKYF